MQRGLQSFPSLPLLYSWPMCQQSWLVWGWIHSPGWRQRRPASPAQRTGPCWGRAWPCMPRCQSEEAGLPGAKGEGLGLEKDVLKIFDGYAMLTVLPAIMEQHMSMRSREWRNIWGEWKCSWSTLTRQTKPLLLVSSFVDPSEASDTDDVSLLSSQEVLLQEQILSPLLFLSKKRDNSIWNI